MHTAAYWLLWAVRRSQPEGGALRKAEFTTLQIRLVKVAARVIETATRIRIAFTSACPDKADFVTALSALRTNGKPKQQAP